MALSVEELQTLCRADAVRWTAHILTRLLQRGISQEHILQAVCRGEIIEQYPDDYPYPSCLVLGYTSAGSALHAVCGKSENEIWMITAYYPNQLEWESDLKTRRRKMS